MATKRRRGSTWHYVIKRKGLLPRPVYLTFDDEGEGDQYVANLESLLDHGIVPREFIKDDKLKTLRQCVVAYVEVTAISSTDRGVLDVLLDRIGSLSLSECNYDWAEQWVSAMKRRQHLAPSTIRHHVGALARCLDWACRRGLVPANPLRLLPKRYATYTAKDAVFVKDRAVPTDTEGDRRLEPGEHERILRVLTDDYVPEGRERGLALHHREALILMYWWATRTGMRLGEIYTLTPDQVDVGRRTIFLDRTKNGSKRQVPLFPDALAAWEAYATPRGATFVFPWWQGGGEAERRRVTSLLSRQWARIFAQAECPGLTFHCLRHEATCWVYLNTRLSDVEIAKMMGWKSMKMALRYANIRGSDLAAKVV